MRVHTHPLWLPKAGNPLEDYEDAFWPAAQLEREARVFRAAVADGATETSFSALWAQLLVRGWCRGHLSLRHLSASLPRLQRAWLDSIAGRPLPWYAEEKLRSGAFSSLLGLTLRRAEDESASEGTWSALAVGDSCLFQVREDELLCAFPLTRSECFNSRPHLLSSNPAANGDLAASVTLTSGAWAAGDIFYLMTDALACWFLHSTERGCRPWRTLTQLRGGGKTLDFEQLVTSLRQATAMRNDDVTLLSVSLST